MQNQARQWKEVFNEIYKSFQHNINQTLSFKDEEDLHQARVDLRKLLTMMEVLLSVDQQSTFLKTHSAPFNKTTENLPERLSNPDPLLICYRSLKKVLKRLGKLRDFDVFYLEVNELGKNWQRSARKNLKRGLLTMIDYNRQLIRVKLLMQELEVDKPKFRKAWRSAITIKALVPRLEKINIDVCYEQLLIDFFKKYREYRKISLKQGMEKPESIEALHRVRIVSKKLRYAGKYLAFALQAERDKNVKGYKRIQEFLGDVNDYANYLELINSLQRKYPHLANKQTTSIEKLITNKLDKTFKKLYKELEKHKIKNGEIALAISPLA